MSRQCRRNLRPCWGGVGVINPWTPRRSPGGRDMMIIYLHIDGKPQALIP